MTVWKGNRYRQLQVWVGGLLLAGCVTALWAQEGEARNPYTSLADVAAGAKTYRTQCAMCHGRDGTGSFGPNLTLGEFRHGSSDAALFRTITHGVPGRGMPATFLPESEVWQLVAYVQSLSQRPRETNLPGNPAQGEKLFRGKGDCSQCHMVKGEGGRLGPDLSDIGWLRSPQHLRTSIVQPNGEVDSPYWSVRIVGKDGKTIPGIRLNEDTYSIQVMDMQENLHSYWKRDLSEIRREKASWMPSYEEVFSESEIDDLVAYLYSLRRKAKKR